MKIRVLALVVTAGLIGFGMTAFSQEDVTRVEDSAFGTRMRPQVPFAHEAHNETAEIDECSVCHHLYEDGKRVEGESSEDSECSECHAPDAESYPLSLVRAYHLRCKGCHMERKSGPVMCAECHPRN